MAHDGGGYARAPRHHHHASAGPTGHGVGTRGNTPKRRRVKIRTPIRQAPKQYRPHHYGKPKHKRITEDSPKWNARTMGNRTGMQKVSAKGYAVYFRGRQIGGLRDKQSAQQMMHAIRGMPYRRFAEPRLNGLGQKLRAETSKLKYKSNKNYRMNIKAEDDAPTFTRSRLPGGFQTKRSGRMSGTVPFR